MLPTVFAETTFHLHPPDKRWGQLSLCLLTSENLKYQLEKGAAELRSAAADVREAEVRNS